MAVQKKKDIPLVLLQKIQPIIEANSAVIHQVKDEKAWYRIVDNDPASDFYFAIIGRVQTALRISYTIERRPTSSVKLEPSQIQVPIEDMDRILNIWIEVIRGYEKVKSIYDDPILKSYEAEFEKKFDIIDNDADVAPFDLEQQLYLDNYLNEVKKTVALLKEGRTQEAKEYLDDIENEANEIKRNLTQESKRKIVQRLSRLWAKSRKVGLDVLKEIFVNVSSELIRKLLTGGS